MNLLAVDIGNSSFKCGLFKNERLTNFKYFENINSIINYYSKKKIDDAAVSSVVPKNTNRFVKEFKKEFNISPFIINRKSNFNLKINYRTISTLGIDRICSAEGAHFLFQKDNNFNKNVFLLTIDCGTASTINLIKFPCEFMGGLISPGFKMMFNALKNNTSQLPQVSEKNYKNFIGDSTKSSIASGVINSNIGLIEKTVSHIKSTFKAKEIKIYITGRNGRILLKHLDSDCIFEKALVLYGIKSVYYKNMQRQE